MNRRGGANGASPATNNGVYITFAKKEDAARAIDAFVGIVFDGRFIRFFFKKKIYELIEQLLGLLNIVLIF